MSLNPNVEDRISTVIENFSGVLQEIDPMLQELFYRMDDENKRIFFLSLAHIGGCIFETTRNSQTFQSDLRALSRDVFPNNYDESTLSLAMMDLIQDVDVYEKEVEESSDEDDDEDVYVEDDEDDEEDGGESYRPPLIPKLTRIR